MLNIYQLSIFLAVAETGSFSMAAERLNLTQPAVSLQIKTLERQLGLTLFDRQAPKLSLSEAGEALLPLARALVRMAEQVEQEMCSFRGIVTGRLIIACSTAPGEYLLPRLIARYREKYPAVRVILEMTDSATVIRRLRDEQVDIGCVGWFPKEKWLEGRKFIEDELVLVVPRSHPWASRTTVNPEELKNVPFILREEGSGTRRAVVEGLTPLGITLDELNVVLEVGSTPGAAQAVAAGLGVSIISRLAVLPFRDQLQIVPLDAPPFKRDIYLARNLSRPHACAHSRFCEFILEPETLAWIQDQARGLSQ